MAAARHGARPGLGEQFAAAEVRLHEREQGSLGRRVADLPDDAEEAAVDRPQHRGALDVEQVERDGETAGGERDPRDADPAVAVSRPEPRVRTARVPADGEADEEGYPDVVERGVMESLEDHVDDRVEVGGDAGGDDDGEAPGRQVALVEEGGREQRRETGGDERGRHTGRQGEPT
ncbi:hypothetical protein [Halosegnis marinus]|uniref:hypothetical protein n=1 Tax=Halosegnis marinus TaxID=3034023 RepID=UPI00360D9E19